MPSRCSRSLPRSAIPSVDVIAAFAGTKAHASALAEIVAPEGHIGMIEGDGPAGMAPEDFGKLFSKAAALHFELMFVRPRGGATMIRQHEILERRRRPGRRTASSRRR